MIRVLLLSLALVSVVSAQPTTSVSPSKSATVDKAATSATLTEDEKKAAGWLCGGIGIATIIGGLVLTFLPIVIAVLRGHPNTIPIALVTILLGWTVIGWIVALIWSFTNPPRR